MGTINNSVEQQLSELTEKNALLEKERDNLRELVGEEGIGKPIAGSLQMSLTDIHGKTKNGNATFSDGHLRVRVYSKELGWNDVCNTEALLAHANSKATDPQIADNKVLSQMTSDDARDYVTDLVKMGYAYVRFNEVG